jgi:hypothetical protein
VARTKAKQALSGGSGSASELADVAPRAPSLSELQGMFQEAILKGGDDILKLIPPNSHTNAQVLFGVYRNAYVGRLVEIIGADHPLTAMYLGDDAFGDLARSYVAAHPSTTQNARWVSRHLTEFARQTPRFAPHRQVGDLIAIEAALNTAFDAADAEPVTIAALQQTPPEQWDMLVFTPHPSAQKLTLSSNALDLWLALKDDAEVPEAEEGSVELLVWRQEASPMLRPLGAEEAMMWTEAAKGVRFGVLCEMLATFDDPDNAALRAAQYLQGWLLSGALAGAAVSARRRRTSKARADLS